MPWAPTALCLRLCCKESLGGRPLAFVLGSGLSIQVRACEGAPPGSPACQDPLTRGLGIAVTLSSELFTAHITAGPVRPRTGACRTPTAVTSPRLVKPLLGSGWGREPCLWGRGVLCYKSWEIAADAVWETR